MTHKTFYQLAAAEVAAGRLDDALWIKVNAELPNADERTRQAKYIALRAEEMAMESAKYRVRRWLPHSFWSWAAYLVVAGVIAIIIADITAAIGQLGSTPIPIIVLAVIMIVAVAVAWRAGRVA